VIEGGFRPKSLGLYRPKIHVITFTFCTFFFENPKNVTFYVFCFASHVFSNYGVGVGGVNDLLSAVATGFTISANSSTAQETVNWVTTHESRLPTGAFTPRHDATRLRCRQICSDSSRLSPTSCEFCTHHRRDSTIGLRPKCESLISCCPLMQKIGHYAPNIG